MFLLIDNYDSFAHNLARYFEIARRPTKIIRNDALTIAQIQKLNPHAIIISPGPKAPKDAGLCLEIIKTFAPATPILGICLGHQAICQAYGGITVASGAPIHGRASNIKHGGTGIFKAIPSPMQAGRYHALKTSIPNTGELEMIAQTNEGETMAVQHKIFPCIGLQFHPESILTQHGQDLINNFVQITHDYHNDNKGLTA